MIPDLRAPGDERGSVLPLILGYAVLAIALILVCTGATSLYLAQKRIDALADSAALAAADGIVLSLEDGEPRARLDDGRVAAQAQGVIDAVPGGGELVSAGTSDGVSVRVVVATVWHPPVISSLLPGGVPLEAVGTSRTALD